MIPFEKERGEMFTHIHIFCKSLSTNLRGELGVKWRHYLLDILICFSFSKLNMYYFHFLKYFNKKINNYRRQEGPLNIILSIHLVFEVHSSIHFLTKFQKQLVLMKKNLQFAVRTQFCLSWCLRPPGVPLSVWAGALPLGKSRHSLAALLLTLSSKSQPPKPLDAQSNHV